MKNQHGERRTCHEAGEDDGCVFCCFCVDMSHGCTWAVLQYLRLQSCGNLLQFRRDGANCGSWSRHELCKIEHPGRVVNRSGEHRTKKSQIKSLGQDHTANGSEPITVASPSHCVDSLACGLISCCVLLSTNLNASRVHGLAWLCRGPEYCLWIRFRLRLSVSQLNFSWIGGLARLHVFICLCFFCLSVLVSALCLPVLHWLGPLRTRLRPQVEFLRRRNHRTFAEPSPQRVFAPITTGRSQVAGRAAVVV